MQKITYFKMCLNENLLIPDYFFILHVSLYLMSSCNLFIFRLSIFFLQDIVCFQGNMHFLYGVVKLSFTCSTINPLKVLWSLSFYVSFLLISYHINIYTKLEHVCTQVCLPVLPYLDLEYI